MKKLFIVDTEYHDTRIDRWLKNNFSTLNQSFIDKNLRKGNIKVNDSKVLAKYKLQHKDKIILFNYSAETYRNVTKLIKKIIIPKKYLDLFNSSILLLYVAMFCSLRNSSTHSDISQVVRILCMFLHNVVCCGEPCAWF